MVSPVEIQLGPGACGDLSISATREWLVPDGRGGYAMGTVAGVRTRRYHGLLVVADGGPARRRTGLVALDPTLVLPSGARVRLGAHEWASGAVDPTGFAYLERFDLTDGLPRWRWRIGDVVLERELAMAHGTPYLGVVHRLLAGGPVGLVLDALCTWRDAHTERTGPAPLRTTQAGDGVLVEDAYRVAGPGFTPTGGWWLGAYHREEAARGLNPTEDLWHAGQFAATLDRPGAVAGVCAWAAPGLAAPPRDAAAIVDAARRRNRAVVAAAKPADPVAASLALAADAFVVRTSAGPDVVAGYPWFGAWSRDTMISYAGLFLATRRADEGRDLLRAYAATVSEGMLANTADTGRTEYNTVDGTLWFLHAVDRHVAATGDTDLAADLLPVLRDIIDAHLAGTRYGIRVDPADGLLTQGAAGEALTWMDARVDGVAATPRRGKPVEVNALWVNGLAAVAGLAARVPEHTRRAGTDVDTLRRLHGKARAAFGARFPIPGGRWLFDVIDGPGGDDAALRPNQLFAYSLPHAPLEPDPGVSGVLAAALLTPLGPRSLTPGHPDYRPAHRGDAIARDLAYHQGTVWPWLIGAFVDATRRDARHVGELFTGLTGHLAEWGLGSVSETADAQPPHAATGCPFQAWSVAELLRARG